MKKLYPALVVIIAFFFVASSTLAYAQQQFPTRTPFSKPKNRSVAALPMSGFSVTPVSPAQLVSYLLGPGASISNLTYTGSPLALGLFIDSTSFIGLDTGIVISTGNVTDIPGINTSTAVSTSFDLPGDSALNMISGFPTYDASIIEFDVLVLTDTLGADFVFASEEYPEYANSSFNDLFAFFVSGPGITGQENIAYIPGSNTIISINNINNGAANTGPCVNCQYYIDNLTGQEIEFDGLTTPFSLSYPIINGQTFHFKIALADCGDGIFDSGIFLKKGSVLGKACLPVASFTAAVSGLTAQFTNTTNYAQYYTWDYGDGSVDTTASLTNTHLYSQAGLYQVTLQAHNYYQTGTFSQLLNVGGVGIPVISTIDSDIKLQKIQGNQYKINVGQARNAEIRVYAITGELKYSSSSKGNSEVSFDISTFAKGMYILQVNTAEKNKTWKLTR